ncbi:MAG: hypothetical protein NT076_05555 [Candidatus Pacearchaeota archaeon]|nr:hypothetical protein [Candidatus Pacearchaeota archaeon]
MIQKRGVFSLNCWKILGIPILFILLINTVYAEKIINTKLSIARLNPEILNDYVQNYPVGKLVFNDFSVNFLEIKMEDGFYELNSSSKELFEARLMSSRKKQLYSISFYPDFTILSDPPIELNETVVELNFPYSLDAKYIEIYYKNIKKLSVDISKQLCNKNKKCDGNENYLSCPGECKFYSNDSLCLNVKDWFNLSLEYWGDNYCDRDCYNDDDCFKANCNDGKKNGNETGIDCGKVCFNTCKYPNKIITGMSVYEEREGFWAKFRNFF